MKIDILSHTQEQLSEEILKLGEKKFRSKQIFDWLHIKRVTSFKEMTNISAQLISVLDENFYINRLKIEKRLISALDNTIKYLYRLPDGEVIETVLMEYNHGNSICISSQVGCRMGCKFCASTIGGLSRNLSPSEMLLQIYETARDSLRDINSVVMMGIGEPMDNFENVLAFLEIINSSMSLRHLSLSTCGHADKIRELADKRLGLTLSISLHAGNDVTRSSIMPINNKYNIAELMSACRYYFEKTGRRISFEYALIEGVNDDEKSAAELIALLKGFVCHVNLIPINPIKERSFKKSNYVSNFQKILTNASINATIRRTLGADINAACGQLRAESKDETAVEK